MSNQIFHNQYERQTFPIESAQINGDNLFTVIANDLVLEQVDETALNTQILSVDFAGLVSWKDEQNLNPFDQSLDTDDIVKFERLAVGSDLFSPTCNTFIQVRGPESSIPDSPGIELGFTSDDDPAAQLNAFSHDEVSLTFDACVNNNQLCSGSINSNWIVRKDATSLQVKSATGNVKGTNFTYASMDDKFDLNATTAVFHDELLLETVNTDLALTDLLVWDSTGKEIKTRTLASLPAVNPFDQPLNTTDPCIFTTIDTGNGPVECFNMNQDVLTSDSPTFVTGTLTGVANDNTETKLLVIDSVTDVIEYRTVASLPVVNPFDQPLNTTDPCIFTTIDTGNGPAECFNMNQDVLTSNSPTFVTGTLTGVANDNAQTKLLVLDSVTDVIEYRTVASLPAVNPFDQPLNTTDPCIFTAIDTGQGAVECYAMDQSTLMGDDIQFENISIGAAYTSANCNSDLNIVGPSGSVNDSPGLSIGFDSDTGPAIHINAQAHDDSAIYFDCCNDDGTIVSGSVAGNIAIEKAAGGLRFLTKTGIAPGGSVAPFNIKMVVDDTTGVEMVGALKLSSVVGDNAQTQLLVLDSVSDVVEFRTVASLPVVNFNDQPLNTTDPAVFTSVNTGHGANELYQMNQDVLTSNSPSFANAVLTATGDQLTEEWVITRTFATGVLGKKKISNPAYGEVFFDGPNGTTTAITTQNVIEKVLGSTDLGLVSDFDDDSATNNRLRYTGTQDAVISLNCAFELLPANSSAIIWQVELRHGLAAGGFASALTNLQTQIQTEKVAQFSSSIHGLITMEEDDFVELWITNTSSTIDVTVPHMSLTGCKLKSV